ncbi:Cupin 1 [Dillenia turbinata]|uniref:Germin-like protein n=1 Tax=Dillenia turbinata TaxID=194707 RepID=A0AAN8Z8Z5_9MAGN
MIKFIPYFHLGLALLVGLAQSDPHPLHDFCVADTAAGSQTFLTNDFPCINPELALPSHFATSALAMPGNTRENPSGFNVTLATISNLPGLNTLGLTLARADLAPNGLIPPHSHPRASEVTICLQGTLLVGFVDTSNRLLTQQLRVGDSFVFPKGLIHFVYNLEASTQAIAVSGLNSQSPGAQIGSMSSFASHPNIPDEVLQKAYLINGQDVARIRRNLGG